MLVACGGGGRATGHADGDADRPTMSIAGAGGDAIPAGAAGMAGAAPTDAATGGASGTGGDGGDATDGGVLDAHDAGVVLDTTEPPADGAPGCPGLICEDFERGAVDPAKWDQQVSGGTMMVQQQLVAHGRYALQVHGQSGPTDWALLLAKNVPAGLKGSTTFGRVYFYITPKPLTSGHTEMVFAGHTGAGAANGPAPFPKLRYMEVANIGGGWQLGFDLLDVGPLVEEVSYPKGQVPTTAWVCLEWEFEDHPDHITMWTDGVQIGTFDDQDIAYASPGPVPKPGSPIYAGTSTDIVGGFEVFGFGFHDWHPQKPFDLYYDDLVLDSKRIGCLR